MVGSATDSGSRAGVSAAADTRPRRITDSSTEEADDVQSPCRRFVHSGRCARVRHFVIRGRSPWVRSDPAGGWHVRLPRDDTRLLPGLQRQLRLLRQVARVLSGVPGSLSRAEPSR